ncbi:MULTISPECIES: nuclear transport factor 2 family protein [Halomonadaceae]|uniref:nuclear transport factor 2 family protein n=1 Tax=Halomonadaceae TaxID=28256 RepID=UPI0003171EA8|nr:MULTISPECIES: nuclear transport factor 2 family protein [Halomonas]ATH77691.1 nuclear transport factor 2 family protein [Halomonas hydrothermalis]KHJ50881.1 tautomerase [Halomonas hydrothermalis]UDM06701.1 nuclear transport factor 2 family protein [Halomonas sp. NyZ770]
MKNTQCLDVHPHDVQQVLTFLDAMEARDLPLAQRCLAEHVVMQFPGAPAMHHLDDVVAWARHRYRRVSKTFHAVNHCLTPRQSIVVCHGELAVEWLDGSTSASVRFIDRFELTDGLITRQDVWNDLALAQPAPHMTRPL